MLSGEVSEDGHVIYWCAGGVGAMVQSKKVFISVQAYFSALIDCQQMASCKADDTKDRLNARRMLCEHCSQRPASALTTMQSIARDRSLSSSKPIYFFIFNLTICIVSVRKLAKFVDSNHFFDLWPVIETLSLLSPCRYCPLDSVQAVTHIFQFSTWLFFFILYCPKQACLLKLGLNGAAICGGSSLHQLAIYWETTILLSLLPKWEHTYQFFSCIETRCFLVCSLAPVRRPVVGLSIFKYCNSTHSLTFRASIRLCHPTGSVRSAWPMATSDCFPVGC